MKKTTQTQSPVSVQLETFFTLQTKHIVAHFSDHDSKQEGTRLLAWAQQFAQKYLQSRLHRSQDLSTEEIAKAQKLARTFIGEGNHDFFATCVDGRNMPTVMFSKPPHVGGVLRAPAGAVTGFMEGQHPGTVYIDYDSFVVKQIGKLLEERSGETIFYGLDSHVGCAARGLVHSTEGGKQSDSGLRSDVKSKLMTAKGVVQLRQTLIASGKKVAEIIPTFFSYDPHSGGVIAGLEMHVDDKAIVKVGYTEEMLDALARDGKIIRTIDLLEDPEILSALQQVMEPGSADFRKNFAVSMLKNWEAITKLYDSGTGAIYEKIHAQLTKAYTHSGWQVSDKDDCGAKMISKRTIKQKAKFLMKNLLTRFSIAGASHKWPYGHHKEDLAVITDGGYAPFEELDAFAVFSRDLNALLPNTKLTIDLIRSFRKSASISDPVEGSDLTPEEFASAPVLISSKAVVRTINSEEWKQISQVDVSEVCASLNWDDSRVLSYTKTDVQELIAQAFRGKKVNLPIDVALSLVDGVYELFDRMRIMMKDKYFRQMILHGNIVVINTIVNSDRAPQMVIPFVV